MAGKEESGPDAADPELFKGAAYAICPAPSASEEATRAIVTMVEAVGAVPYFVDAEEHDSYVAAVSHLPFPPLHGAGRLDHEESGVARDVTPGSHGVPRHIPPGRGRPHHAPRHLRDEQCGSGPLDR